MICLQFADILYTICFSCFCLNFVTTKTKQNKGKWQIVYRNKTNEGCRINNERPLPFSFCFISEEWDKDRSSWWCKGLPSIPNQFNFHFLNDCIRRSRGFHRWCLHFHLVGKCKVDHPIDIRLTSEIVEVRRCSLFFELTNFSRFRISESTRAQSVIKITPVSLKLHFSAAIYSLDGK